MKLQMVILCGFLIFLPFLACDLGEGPGHDPQFVRIQLNYAFRNAVNTFQGTLTKDLAMDGFITVPFWFTTAEQQQIAAELERVAFYELPDTIHRMPGVILTPDPGPLMLRVGGSRGDKRVVMFYPPEQTGGYGEVMEGLGSAIWAIVQTTIEYRRLPAARGGYD